VAATGHGDQKSPRVTGGGGLLARLLRLEQQALQSASRAVAEPHGVFIGGAPSPLHDGLQPRQSWAGKTADSQAADAQPYASVVDLSDEERSRLVRTATELAAVQTELAAAKKEIARMSAVLNDAVSTQKVSAVVSTVSRSKDDGDGHPTHASDHGAAEVTDSVVLDAFAPEVPGQETAFDPEAVHITYESCVQSLTGKSDAKRWGKEQDGPLYWLHIPKCGTSFGATLHGYTCTATPTPQANPADPSETCVRCGPDGARWRGFDHTILSSIPFDRRPYCDWNVSFKGAFKNHIVLAATNDFTRAGEPRAVALFRDPRRRLVSGWNDNKHSYAMGSWWDPRGPDEEVKLMRNSTSTLESYARWPGIAGCQVKMLVGEDCSVPLNITRAIYEEAERRLHNMAFVGLTDAFNASVCLFHHMFGGVPEEYMFTTHSRSGAKLLKRKQLQCGVGTRLPRDAWKSVPSALDPHDHRLFEAAKGLFAARLRRHGLWDGPDPARLKHICRDTRTLGARGCRFRRH